MDYQRYGKWFNEARRTTQRHNGAMAQWHNGAMAERRTDLIMNVMLLSP
jgi:hypothetical protein